MFWNKLVPVSLGLAVACFGMAELHTRARNEYIKKCKFFLEAIDTLKSHHGAILLLGEPIEYANPSMKPSSWFFNGVCDFEVPVKGPKSNGILILKAIGENFGLMELDTLHLQLRNDKSKRLIIKESEPRNIGA